MTEVTEKLPPEGGAPLIRVTGRIKWFDPVKGYGFVVPDDKGETGGIMDVMLHVSCLRDYGEKTADEGARIICEIQHRPRGWQVVEIIDMDRPQSALIQDQGEALVYEPVVVKWFNTRQGFGFVNKRADQADIFIHISVLRKAGYEEVDTGMELDVITGTGNKGQNVILVRKP